MNTSNCSSATRPPNLTERQHGPSEGKKAPSFVIGKTSPMNTEKRDTNERGKGAGSSRHKKDSSNRSSLNMTSRRGKCTDLRATAVSPTYSKNFFSTSTPKLPNGGVHSTHINFPRQISGSRSSTMLHFDTHGSRVTEDDSRRKDHSEDRESKFGFSPL